MDKARIRPQDKKLLIRANSVRWMNSTLKATQINLFMKKCSKIDPELKHTDLL
jgi:hypothetical protein